jgi:sugar lactone lactonase YvrE
MVPKRVLSTLVVLCACFATFFAFDASAAAGKGSASVAPVATSRVPLYFEENQGQTAGAVRFLARAGGYTAFLTGDETVLHYQNGLPGQKDTRDAVVRMKLAGSRKSPSIRGGERLPGVVNYLIGNDPSKWHTRIPTYGEVRYDKVYSGVDMVYRAAGKQLEFDFHVAPGANPAPIRMTYSGPSKMHLNAAGDLVLETTAGQASILKPVAYQDIDNQRVPVAADYAMLPGGEVGFKLGNYDRSRELVIDPTVGPSVYYSTYLGSGEGDTFTSIAVDPSGLAFITGSTYSSNYPTGASPGYLPYSSAFPANYAANSTPAGFITALNATGTGIIYSTYISGNSATSSTGAALNAIAVNASGNAFVGGQTDDSTFPTYKAFQATYPTSRLSAYGYGNAAAIVFELSPHGDSLVYSSFLGGGDTDSITAIALDSSSNAYVTGTNQVGYYYLNPPNASAFPVTSGVVWGRYPQGNIGAGFTSAFATKIAPPSSGNASLVYSTVIGVADTGSGNGSNWPMTYGKSIAVDPSGNAYVAGTTNCDIGANHSGIAKTLKMTNVSLGWSGCYNTNLYQTWVVELNPAATAATYLAYLGGSAPVYHASWDATVQIAPNTSVAGIAVDSTGQVYVAGTTQANNFQTTAGAYQTTKKLAGVANSSGYPQADGFATLIAPSGASFAYSTYLNGTTVSSGAVAASRDGSLSMGGIALGAGGQFAVSGVTTTTDFPVSGNPAGTPLLSAFPGCPGSCAAGVPFVTKFTTSGLVYSTLLGAGGESAANGIASNGTDIYAMFKGSAPGLTTGGAYDADNSSYAKELIVRLQDAQALSTTVTVDGKTANPSSSDQTVSLTSSIGASSTVNGGTVTYAVTDSSSAEIGSAVTSGIVSTGVAPSASFTLPANTPSGTYTIHADYKGAQGFLNSTGTGSLVVASPKPTPGSVTLSSSPHPSVFGQSVRFTTTVSASGANGTPTGRVTLSDGGTPIGTITLDGTGQANFTTSALTASAIGHTISASYSGDSTYAEDTSNTVTQVVNKADTTTTVTSSTNPSLFGQSVTFTATVSPVAPGAGTPTGTVTFLDNGNPIGSGTLSGSGVATFATSLSVANHTITTNYVGDGNFNGSTGSLTGNPQVVNKANTTTTVTSTANPSVYGQVVTFTATISPAAPGAGTPTGTVTFYDDGSPIGSGVLSGSGVATFTTSALSVSSHTITTYYGGDGNFNGSTGSLTGNPQVVNKATSVTTVNSAPNPSVYGQSVTFTATVSAQDPGAGTRTGTVIFADNRTPIGSGILSGGVATFTTSALTVANHNIEASYGGDGNFVGSVSSTLPHTVISASTTTTVTASPNPSVYGQPVTVTATISPIAPGAGTPTGTVTSVYGSATLSGGVATFTTSALTGGSDTIAVVYVGDGNFSGSTGTTSQTVIPATPVITWNAPASVNSATPLSAAQLNATASVPGTFVYSPPAGTFMAAGAQTLSVLFLPNDPMDYTPASATVSLAVTQSPVAVGTSSSPEWVTVKFATAGTVGSVNVLTQGAPNLDFQQASGGNCIVGSTYNAGDTCSVMVTLAPKYAGPRMGAVVLRDGSGNALATTLISGIGQGPQVVFPSNASTNTLGSGFNMPYGLAVDASGNVYVADTFHYAVKQIVAVNGVIPSNPTINTLATGFDGLNDVAVDGAGNVYAADIYHNAVKKITVGTGTVISLGSGFNQPYGVAVDANGNVFVADHGNSAVKEIVAATGETKTLGSGFSSPWRVAVDGSGNVFVADTGNNAVKQIVAVNGVIPDNPTINTVGSGFNQPKALAVDAAGDVLVIDSNFASAVKEIVAVNGAVSDSSTVITLPAGGLHYPAGVAVDGSGNIFVVDTWNNLVKQIPLATPPSLSFADTKVGAVSDAQDVTVQNVGNAQLSLSQIAADANFSFAGPDATCASSGQSLDSGASCILGIQFAPTAVGNPSGNVVLTDNALNQSDATQNIAVTGTATPGDTTTGVTADANPQTYGSNVTFTAAVTPSAATGTVTFYDNGTQLGAPQPISGGQATLTISTLTAGSHQIKADYSGDPNYLVSSGTMTETINQATPVITWAAPSDIIYGTALSGAQLNASTTIGGTWSYSPASGTVLTAGPQTLDVTFTPNDALNYTIATSSVTLAVNKATASVTPNAAGKTYGTTDPAFTGTLTGFLASDNVTATYSRTAGETVGGSPYTISATLTPTGVLGNYTITYNTANFAINKAAASVAPNSAGKTYGASDPALTGTLSGFVAGDNVTASYTRTAGETVAGSPYTVSATLAPSGVLGNYTITYNTANFTINKATASVTPTAASKIYGTSDPTLTGATTGFVAGDNVTATYTRTPGETVAGGPYTISAALAPSGVLGNYNITYDTASFAIDKAAASVTPRAASKTYGTADPTMTGSLSGFLASDSVTASYTRTAGETVAGSPYTISATLSPAAALSNYDINYGTAAFAISKATTTATLQSSTPVVMLMSSFTLTAKVTSANGAPTGSVSFMDGTTALGSGALDNTGTATLPVSTLHAGIHSLTAVYSGDSNFSGFTSTPANQTVQDFQLTATGGTGTILSATVLPGGVATYQLQITPTNGTTFPAALTLSLSGLPAGATYTITPATIAAGSASQTITVQVQTLKVVAGLRSRGANLPLYALGLLLPMFGMVHLRWSGARRKKHSAFMLCLLLAVGILSMSACGGVSGFLNQAPQTYNLQLNGTSGALQHSATLNLTIQ